MHLKAAIFVSCNPQSNKQCCSGPTVHLVYCLPHCSEEPHLYSQPTTMPSSTGQILHFEYNSHFATYTFKFNLNYSANPSAWCTV